MKINFKREYNVEAILKIQDEIILRQIIHNVATTVGKRHIADQLSLTPAQDPMGYMATGTGADAGDDPTVLTTELSRLALTYRTQQAGDDANKVLYQCTWIPGVGTGTITEAGIFNAAVSGVMLCYVHFDSAIPKVASAELTLKWTGSID